MWAATGSLVAPDMLARPHPGRPPARSIIPRQRTRIVAAAAPEVESKGRKGKRASNRAQSGNAYAGPSRPKRGGPAQPRKVDDDDEMSDDDGAYDETDDEQQALESQEEAAAASAAAAANEQKLERTSSRLAVAAKISAARALARKLADEKAAAAAAAKLGGGAVNTAVEAYVWVGGVGLGGVV